MLGKSVRVCVFGIGCLSDLSKAWESFVFEKHGPCNSINNTRITSTTEAAMTRKALKKAYRYIDQLILLWYCMEATKKVDPERISETEEIKDDQLSCKRSPEI